jgi:hypothetical protein
MSLKDGSEPPAKKSKPEVDQNDEHQTKSLPDLPELPVLKIASYLRGKDLFRFTHSCRNVFQICDKDGSIWSRLLDVESFPLYPEIKAAATNLIENEVRSCRLSSEDFLNLLSSMTLLNETCSIIV